MWIDQSQTAPGGKMLQHHIPQESCFSRTRFADDVGMMPSIRFFDAEQGLTAAPMIAVADINHIFVHDAKASFESKSQKQPDVWKAASADAPANVVLIPSGRVVEAGCEV